MIITLGTTITAAIIMILAVVLFLKRYVSFKYKVTDTGILEVGGGAGGGKKT